jgi:glucose-1-phosphate cytidylyltransferase
VKTVILCGGFGTRIRGVDDDLPKPMIPIGGKPILWHIMSWYARFGHNDFVLCLGHKGEKIKGYFLDYRRNTEDLTVSLATGSVHVHDASAAPKWTVTLAETGQNTMTGARVKRIKKYVDENDFMLTYGDGLGDVDIGSLVRFHLSHGKVLTITGVRPPGRFGELEVDGGGMVTEFNEKPNTTGGLISGGFFVCKREIFDYIDSDDGVVFEKEPMKRLVAAGQLMVYRHEGFWQPMDTYREFALLNELYASGNAPWAAPGGE